MTKAAKSITVNPSRRLVNIQTHPFSDLVDPSTDDHSWVGRAQRHDTRATGFLRPVVECPVSVSGSSGASRGGGGAGLSTGLPSATIFHDAAPQSHRASALLRIGSSHLLVRGAAGIVYTAVCSFPGDTAAPGIPARGQRHDHLYRR